MTSTTHHALTTAWHPTHHATRNTPADNKFRGSFSPHKSQGPTFKWGEKISRGIKSMTAILQPGKVTSLGLIPEMKNNVQLKWKMSHNVRVQLIDKASNTRMWLALL